MRLLSQSLGLLAAAGLLSALLAGGLAAEATVATPVGWRTDGNGAYQQATPPTRWSAGENVRWKTPMPGKSYGSPILVGDKLLAVSDPAELLCLDAASGEILWRRTVSAAEALGAEAAARIQAQWNALTQQKQERERALNDLRKNKPDAKTEAEAARAELKQVENQLDEFKRKFPIQNDRGSGNTAATPVSDGRRVYAAFGTGIVACFTLAGEPQWIKFIEGSVIGFGHSSSPVLVSDKLVVHFHDLVALDAATGEVAWRAPLEASHASPIVARVGDQPALVSPAGSLVRASDGAQLAADPALRLAEGSSIFVEGVLYAQGERTTAFRLPTGGDLGRLEQLWQASASRGRRTPSPVLHAGLLYGATTEGILDVTDAATGDSVYRKRLDLDENLYSSVTAAGDFIYLSSTKGTTLVLAAGREYREIARNELESLGSTPIFSGRRMYVRGHKNLYCIEE